MRHIRLTWGVAAVVMVMIVGCQKESPYMSSSSTSEQAGEITGGPAASASAPPASTGLSNASANPVENTVGNAAGNAPGTATPAEFSKGESLFKEHCAVCHGGDALGTDHGPPLLNPIYQPDHHSDASFRLAIRNGARAHHWMYGNMPPVQGVNDDDATQIIAYLRWLQHDAGIF